MVFVFPISRRLWQLKPVPRKPKHKEPEIKMLVIPSLSHEAVVEQQHRFDSFLESMKEKQLTLPNQSRMVIYKIHKESGLGNMIRGYMTALVIAIMTNRSLHCVFVYSLSF